MKQHSPLRIKLTAIAITILGFLLTMRSARPIFPLAPLAGAAGLPLLGGVASHKIRDFKVMAHVALDMLINMAHTLAIIGILLGIIILVLSSIWLFKELRRDKVKKILSHLSGLYTAIALLQESGTSKEVETKCAKACKSLGDKLLELINCRFLKRWLGEESHALVMAAIKSIKENGKMSDGQRELVSRYIDIFETMSRW